MSEMTKICTQCREEKNIKEFSVIKNRKGIKNRTNSWCKQCCSLKGRKWKNGNLEKVKSYQKAYNAKNRTRKSLASAKWQRDNPEKCRETKSIYKKRHPQKIAADRRKWVKNNPEKAKQSNRKSTIKCREELSYAYVRQRIRIVYVFPSAKDIPDRFVEKYRNYLILKRKHNDKRKVEQGRTLRSA